MAFFGMRMVLLWRSLLFISALTESSGGRGLYKRNSWKNIDRSVKADDNIDRLIKLKNMMLGQKVPVKVPYKSNILQ